jgi:hypothetical protein
MSTRRHSMSEELERPKGVEAELEDEVEAHGHGPKKAANIEAGDEASGDDEVEAHGHGPKKAANAEAGDEADSDDAFEAHMKKG